jgi:hypothetical protein
LLDLDLLFRLRRQRVQNDFGIDRGRELRLDLLRLGGLEALLDLLLLLGDGRLRRGVGFHLRRSGRQVGHALRRRGREWGEIDDHRRGRLRRIVVAPIDHRRGNRTMQEDDGRATERPSQQLAAVIDKGDLHCGGGFSSPTRATLR